MTGLLWLELGFHAAAAIVAVGVARRNKEHRPIALFLCFTVVADGIACALQELVLMPARLSLGPGVPFTGSVRIAFHASQAMFLSWPAGLAAVALVTLGRRRPWVPFAVWAATMAALVATYPEVRGAVLQRWYLAIELGALAVGTRYAAGWLRRVASRNEPAMSSAESLAGLCALVLVAIDMTGVAVGAWRGNIYTDWHLSQVSYAVEYAALIVLQIGGGIWRTQPQATRSSSSMQ
jgi:hypothetical protein